MHEFGAEILRLHLHVLHQIGTVDPLRKPGEIFHQGGEGKLAAGFMAGNDERLQIGAGRVNSGSVSGATGAYDYHVSHR